MCGNIFGVDSVLCFCIIFIFVFCVLLVCVFDDEFMDVICTFLLLIALDFDTKA